MDFVRQVIDSNALMPILSLPPSFHGVQVEVIVLPVDTKNDSLSAPHSFSDSAVSVKPVTHSAYGRLKAYANPSLIPEEKGAWEKAVAEKYAVY